MPPSAVQMPPAIVARRKESTPVRRRATPAPAQPTRRRRLFSAALLFAAVVLATDALVGEKGWFVTTRARQQAQAEIARLDALREENARLREEKRRLNDDAETIEAEARRQLGLARPGEVMFILKDVRPATTRIPGGKAAPPVR